jgi:DnaK suppressor protein
VSDRDPHERARQRLLDLRRTSTDDLARAVQSARPVDLDQPIGRLSRMDAIQQQSMAAAHRQRLVQRLDRIASALGRIEAGTYGDCLRCGEPIDERRLAAQPEATLCRACQQGGDD